MGDSELVGNDNSTLFRRWSETATEYRYLVLWLSSLALFATTFTRLLISPLASTIIDSFSMTASGFGFASTVMWAALACSQFPGGLLGNRYGERRIILVALIITAFAGLFLAVSPYYAAFIASMALLGVGTGFQYPSGTSLITKMFSNTGKAIGIHITASPIAGLIAPIVATQLSSQYGWRFALLTGVLVAVAVFLLCYRHIRPTEPAKPDESLREQANLSTLFELVSRPSIAYTLIIAILADYAWQATFTFLPLFLESFHGYSATIAGTVFGGYFVVQTAAQPVAGWLSDRIGRDPSTILLASCGIVGYITLVVSNGFLFVAAGTGFVALGMSWSAPVQSRFMDHLSEDEQGTGFGLVRTLYVLIGALGNVVTGVLASKYGWSIAFTVLSVLMGAVVGILLLDRGLSSETYRRITKN